MKAMGRNVGFGDAIGPPPVEIDFPTLLDTAKPRLRAYPPETVIAEKLEAMVKLGIANSRMKDFAGFFRPLLEALQDGKPTVS